MKRQVKTYLDMMGMNTDYLSVSCVADILRMAVKDKITQLLMNQQEFEIFESWMIYSAMWNWDKKTFMGIELIIEK